MSSSAARKRDATKDAKQKDKEKDPKAEKAALAKGGDGGGPRRNSGGELSVKFAPNATMYKDGKESKLSSIHQAEQQKGRESRLTTRKSNFHPDRSSERSMYSTASMAVKAIKRRKRKEMEERRREKCEKALEIAVYAASPLCVVCATMAVIEGVTKLEECPIEPMIPVFALMFGCFSALIHTLTWIWYKFEYDTSMKGKSNRKMNWLELTLIVLHSILFIWILQGLFWTFYRIDELQLTVAALGNDAISELYCDCILYFVAVAFPLGHLLMVFLILLPKKILSRQTEAELRARREDEPEMIYYEDLYYLPEDNMTLAEDISVRQSAVINDSRQANSNSGSK